MELLFTYGTLMKGQKAHNSYPDTDEGYLLPPVGCHITLLFPSPLILYTRLHHITYPSHLSWSSGNPPGLSENTNRAVDPPTYKTTSSNTSTL